MACLTDWTDGTDGTDGIDGTDGTDEKKHKLYFSGHLCRAAFAIIVMLLFWLPSRTKVAK